MIDLEEWIRGLDEEDDKEIKDNEQYQRQLFEDYVLRKNDNYGLRRELAKRYANGEPVTGPDGLRKQLAAFDLSYFGRAYLPHYFSGHRPISMKNWMKSGQPAL